MNTKIVLDDGRKFIYPIFKFQKNEHASGMWRNGNIHLSNVKTFRDGQFGGLIDDPREGQVSLHYPIDKSHNFNIYHERYEISLDDTFIYSGSSDFFSETLKWAISEGKETCVLITDIEEVVKKISMDCPELEYVGARPCIYSGRDIGILKYLSPLRDEIVKNNMLAGWIKPQEYIKQKEFRVLWKAREDIGSLNYINRDVNIQNYLIPVEFEGLDALFADKKTHTVGARIVTVEGQNDAWFDIQYPLETFSPVIHKSGDDYLLGFLSPSPSISGGRFHGGIIGVAMTEIGTIGCNVKLKDIVKIEYRLNA